MTQPPPICICGAGTMGSGIAQVFAQNGFPTLLFDVNPGMLQRAEDLISSDLQHLVVKKRISAEEKDRSISLIRFTNNAEECKAKLIVEAVVENEEIKCELINKLFSINDTDTIVATNTSSLSVSRIAANISTPERFAGMHFFNPAPVMKLVEIVSTHLSNDHTIRYLLDVTRQLGKTGVLCKDSPGFIVNRVARPYYLEALYLLENNNCSVETVDELMRATGFRMGPFQLMDLIGNDINFSVSTTVYEALGRPERLKPSPIQERKVKEGLLGRKTGKGYYDYSNR